MPPFLHRYFSNLQFSHSISLSAIADLGPAATASMMKSFMVLEPGMRVTAGIGRVKVDLQRSHWIWAEMDMMAME
jgi:hypothetical protein